MKLPISWLRDWIAFDATPEQVAEALTTRGFYVEGVEQHGRAYPGIVVARVLEVAKHPNADKLSLCRVDGGGGELSIVCGAPNVRADMLVPLATVGTAMPGGLVIKRSKIRGEESQGMLCSARELELSGDHEGILDLAVFLPGAALTPGTPLDSLLPVPDTVLEVEVPFNRPDGLGVIGLAREVKAACAGRWTDAGAARLAAKPALGDGFDLVLEDHEGCASYLAQAIEGVVIGPSPAWLREKLEAMGQRSINNVVDLTNLVLFEFGQPVHAFDLAKLDGPAIRVRRARAGERLTTLDGRERELTDEALIITDRTKPVALAGVMGGANSEVTDATTALLLECAWFQPQRVRRGARALGMATEASKRFERGVDRGAAPAAAHRFLALLLELCPTARLGAGRFVHEAPAPVALTLRPARVEHLVGLSIPAERCAALLGALEFNVERGEPLRVRVPTWRPDCTLEVDLIEEVARANGYDRIPEARMETRGTYAARSAREKLIARAREAMLARGLTEAWSSSLVSEREAVDAGNLLGSEIALVRLANPVSRESEVLRPNLLPGLLRACAHNLRQGAGAVRLFEVGAGFAWPPGATPGPGVLPEEPLMLAAIVCGPRFAHAHDAVQADSDFFDAKGLWEAWLAEMRVDSTEWRAYSAAGWKAGASAEVAFGTSRIAWAGTLAQSLLRGWDIEVPVHAFTVLLEPLAEATTASVLAALPGRFPPVRRDVAFFVPSGVTHLELERTLAGAAGATLRSIELFDEYHGPGTPDGMKSLAYALQFQQPDRTLTEAEVQALQERMVTAVAKQWNGRLRER